MASIDERPVCQAGCERALALPQVLAALAAQAATALGQQAALALSTAPSAEAAASRLARSEEARSLLGEGIALPLPPEQDAASALADAARGMMLDGVQLWRCAQLAQAGLSMGTFAATHAKRCPALAEAAALPLQGRRALAELCQEVKRAVGEDGELCDEASYELGRLRHRGRAMRQKIRAHLTELMQAPAVAGLLQDAFIAVRHGRHCLPIVASFQSKLAGIVHATSQSSETLFIEPASVVAWGNEDAVLSSLAQAEQERVLAALSTRVAAEAATMATLQQQLAMLDVVQATAKLAALARLAAPVLLAPGESLALPQLRHPLLALAGKQKAGNDVALAGGGHGLIVSGPNAGGKTAVLTATGLAVCMAQRGLPIAAAPGAQVPWYPQVHVTLGDGQSLSAGLSSFSAHLRALDEAYRTAGPGDLVLIDEIGAATDPSEGAAIAQATMQALVGRGAALLVSTHLTALKALPHVDGRFVNARMGIDPATLAPTYRLELGLAGQSFALDAAARLPVAAGLLAAARALVASQPSELSRALARVAAQERETAALQSSLRQERDRLRVATLQAAQQAAADHAAVAAAQASAAQQAADALARELSAWRQSRDAERLQGAVAALRKEAKQMRQASHQSGMEDKSAPAERGVSRAAQAALGVGSTVWLASLGQRGEVLEVVGSAANVLVGAMRMRVNVADLSVLCGQRAKEPGAGGSKLIAAEGAKPFAAGSATPSAPGRIDLRGLRLDAAHRDLERALDLSLAEGASVLWVVHGHGTGALREQVRASLDACPYVDAWRPGDGHEGGDGVTIATLGT